jgi:hypothetical protein
MTRPAARQVLCVGFLFSLGFVSSRLGVSRSAVNTFGSIVLIAQAAMPRAEDATDTASPTVDGNPSPEASATPSVTPTRTPEGAPSEEPTVSEVEIPTASASPSHTGSPEPSSTPTLEASSTPVEPGATPTASSTRDTPPSSTPEIAAHILINEVAWAGTLASTSDEWIELANFGSEPVDLTGWGLSDHGDIDIALSGVLPAHSYFLLERTDDSTIADIPGDQIYTGSLSNAGESLWLTDSNGSIIDSANAVGGEWPAGNRETRASMERRGGGDTAADWSTFSGIGGVGHDAAGNAIRGTPRSDNSPASLVPTPTPVPTSLASVTPAPYRSVMINEVAWSGTKAAASDEWIELYNPGPNAIDLSGWSLSDGGDVHISLAGSIAASGFFLLERTDDSTVADIPADQIYTGGLSNAGEILELHDASGNLVDTANADGGGWPAGIEAGRGSMERRGGDDVRSSWSTFTGYHARGHDAEGSTIRGTPGSTNSIFFPTPEPTFIPGRIVINEVLIRPHYDWEGKGGVTTADEFIELFNTGPGDVNLRGWILDDTGLGGSSPYVFDDDEILPAGGFLAMFRSKTRLALNDTGDSVRISAPDGRLIDRITYLKVTAYNLSYGRLPDGSRHLFYGLWPTPFRPNILFVEPTPIAGSPQSIPGVCPDGEYPQGLVPRLVRRPAQARLLQTLGLMRCP